MESPIIVWFRQDLRLSDQPALAAALADGRPVLPLFVWESESEEDWRPGGASQWWLHHALTDLAAQLKEKGLQLILRCGSPRETLRALCDECGAEAVYWNRRYEPAAIAADAALKEQLKDDGWEVKSFNAALLFEPWTVSTQSGGPYKVYTPFSRAVLGRSLPEPVEVSWKGVKGPQGGLKSLEVDDLKLLPKLAWADEFPDAWDPTRKGAEKRLETFLHEGGVRDYATARDEPAVDGTSRLSPYLHWGQIGPREVAAALGKVAQSKGQETFLRELIWREFGYHVLYHFPETPTKPLQPYFKHFPWRNDAKALEAWQKGQTGYPIIDAGMRQLWRTGWMHNRVRMIVGSLLVKHLLIRWEEGARWFWDTLVDADLASNTLGWQWIGGCGADAAPYFRIFNPMTQGSKFDPDGAYVRRWVPELAKLPDKYIHTPWEAPPHVLEHAGVELGETYPEPIIEHKAGRERALEAFETLKERREAS